MMKTNSLGIYIHVPYCKSKCPYCDFYSVISNKADKTPYISAVNREIDDFLSKNVGKYEINTIYFGGGTPNTLKIGEISSILSRFTKENCEISMEFNPFSKVLSTEKEEYLKKIKEIGVNRLSIGAQSFNSDTLKTLGRLHSVEDIYETVKIARKVGFNNISLDLMFAIPNETYESFMKSVECAIDLDVEHISMYSLEFMDGTKFQKMLDSGKIEATSDELDRKIYHSAIEKLNKVGFYQYEISNFAKKGYASKHNMKYWNLEEYVGFGPAAHSLLRDSSNVFYRQSNISDVSEYINNPLAHDVYEKLTLDDEIVEYMITRLRMNEGVNLKAFKKRFGVDIFEKYPNALEELKEYISLGDVILTEEVLALTEKGFDISNKILRIFVKM